MRAEDRPPYEQEDMTEEYSFDELARGLADVTLTRGRLLKLLGAALLGSLEALAVITKPTEASQRKHNHARNNNKKKRRAHRRGSPASKGKGLSDCAVPCPSPNRCCGSVCCSFGQVCCNALMSVCTLPGRNCIM